MKTLDVFCQNLLSDAIRFAVIVNNKGRIIAGQPNNDYKDNVDDGTKQMMFMSLVLEMSMRKELNNVQGEVEYIAARRKNLLIVSIPLSDNLLVLFANPKEDPAVILEHVTLKSQKYFEPDLFPISMTLSENPPMVRNSIEIGDDIMMSEIVNVVKVNIQSTQVVF
jgi:hypothetical protein